MRVLLITTFILNLGVSAFCQSNQTTGKPDTILFENGYVLATTVTDTSGGKITFEKPGSSKHKKIEVDRDDVFSIRYGSTGKEVMVYDYDTLIGNDYTIPDARLFIAGEQDARRGYHAAGIAITSFIIGAASGVVTASYLALAPPYLFSNLTNYTHIHIRHKSVTNLNNVKFDPYLYGYDKVARQRRTSRSLFWGGVGVVAGLVFHFAAGLNK